MIFILQNENPVKMDSESLDLSGQDLRRLPLEITRRQNLRELSLQNNFIKQLRPEIGRLTLLTELNLNDTSA